MAKLTKADAARHLGIARSTLYKLIDQGKVSCAPDGLIDQAELVRVAAYVDTVAGRPRTPADTPVTPAPILAETPYGRPHTPVREHHWTDTGGRPQTSEDVLVDALREQVQDLREQLHEARQNAQAAREREALLLQMVQSMQQRYDRLLDVPRPPTPVPPPGPMRSPQGPPAEDYRGYMRARVLAALEGFPQGRSKGALEEAVGASKSLTNVLTGMYRNGLLVRLARGRYALPAGAR